MAVPNPPTTEPTSTTEPTPTTEPGPVYGGVLKRIWAPPSTPIGWPPSFAKMVKDIKRNSDMIEGLWYMDNNHQLQPVLAESWEISSDGKSITFYLRQGVKFHDGTNWNAQAAKFMFDAYIENKNLGTNTWSSVEVIDEYILRLNLSIVTSIQPYYISNVRFVSPTAYEELGEDGILWHPVGTGPFKFKSYEKDVSLVTERFEDYWGDRPYLDGVEWIFTVDQSAQLASMIAGDAHVLTLSKEAVAVDLENRGFELNLTKSPDIIFLLVDSANPDSPFANKLVRQAANYAINREGYCEAFGYGYWSPQYQITWAWGLNPDIPPYEYDPDKARQLLADADYADGFDTELLIPTTFEMNLYTAIQADLQAVGIRAEIKTIDIGAFIGATRMEGWNGLAGGIIESLDVLYSIVQKFSVTAGKTTYAKLWVPEGMQVLLDEAQATDDFDTQQSLVQQMAKLAYDEAMIIPVCSHGEISIIAEGVHDFDFFPTISGDWWNPCKVWLDEDLHE